MVMYKIASSDKPVAMRYNWTEQQQVEAQFLPIRGIAFFPTTLPTSLISSYLFNGRYSLQERLSFGIPQGRMPLNE